jgi:nucleotide-binding universal stress UspA family protein
MALVALIPLDGTKLSESAYALLPLVKQLGIDTIRLVSVWESAWEESESGRETEELDEVTEKGRAYLEAYLEQQKQEVVAQGFQVETVVRIGRPADELLEATSDVDLILIATHGRSGIARWWLGSTADEVIKESACPCLVIGPNVDVDLAAYEVHRILVPVDGSETAEQALPLAAFIADKTGATLDLIRAMSLTAISYDPGMSMYSAELITSMEDSVKAYLQQVGQKLGNRKVETYMVMGAAGEMLLEHMKEKPADLVVSTTHGRRGVKRAALGSTTDRLLHGSAPVLIFRPSDESPGDIVDAARRAVQI